MQLVRPAFATNPRRFGRRSPVVLAAEKAAPTLGDDLKLFATTFFAGFLFVSILIG